MGNPIVGSMRHAVVGCFCGLSFLLSPGADDESVGGDSDCWAEGFSAAICCDLSQGPRGKAECWDQVYTFERCCRRPVDARSSEGSVSGSIAETAAAAAAGTAAEPLSTAADVQEAEANKVKVKAADVKEVDFKEVKVEEPVSVQSETYAARPLTILPHGGALPPLGDQCWQQGFSWAACCGPGEGPDGNPSCWDGAHTYERCCLMAVPASDQFFDVPRSEPLAECLMGLGSPNPTLEHTAMIPAHQCTEGRYFMLGRVTGSRAESFWNHLPWWGRPKDRLDREDMYPISLTQPANFAFLSGFCVPSACDEEAVGVWIAPCLAPWWRYPSRTPVVVNDTHVRLPPALAIRRVYPDFDHAWVSRKPDSAMAPLYFEFALHEYQRSWNLRGINRWVPLALSLPVLLAGLAYCAGIRWGFIAALAPQASWRRLTAARGPVCFDVCRIILSVLVVLVHAKDHDNWRPLINGSVTHSVWLLVRIFHRVNTSFAVLVVYLCLRRPNASVSRWNPLAWLWSIFCHGIRRLAFLTPLTSFWTYVYFRFAEDIPLNHFLQNHGLYVWYGQMRTQCGRPWHLWSSLFYVHEFFFLDRTMCHNLSIFEGLWQLDVAVFALAMLLGRRLAGVAALLLWYPSVLLEKMTLNEHSLKGVGHRSVNMMPAALATCILLAAWPPVLASKEASETSSAGRRVLRRWVIGTLATLGLIATAVNDVANFSNLGEGGALHEWAMRMYPDGLQYCFWGHLYELPHVVGVFILLREWDNGWSSSNVSGGDSDGHTWIRVLARLAGGINISNLFVYHYCSGYLHDEPMEPSVMQLLGRTCAGFLCSTAVSLFVFFTVEAPCAWLVDFCCRATSLLLYVTIEAPCALLGRCCCKRGKAAETSKQPSEDAKADGKTGTAEPQTNLSKQPSEQAGTSKASRRRKPGGGSAH